MFRALTGGGESCKDSASGNHSGDFVDFRATADRKSSSALKFTKSPTSNTANPRILEENQASPSLRDTAPAVARQSIQKSTQALESTFDKNAKLQNEDSSHNAPFSVIASRDSGVAIHKETTQILESTFEKSHDCGANTPSPSLRDTAAAVAWQNKRSGASVAQQVSLESTSNNLESTFEKSQMDCHADKSARNDRENAISKKVDSRENAKNVSKQPKDSRICKNAQNVSDSQAAGFSKETSANAERYPLFCDDFLKKPAAAAPCTAIAGFVGCRAQSKGAYLAYVTAALRDDSRKSAQKPTPKPSKAQSSSKKPTPEISPSDSKILDEKCGLQGKSQGSYLSGSDRRDFSPLPHFSLKAESPQVDSRRVASGF